MKEKIYLKIHNFFESGVDFAITFIWAFSSLGMVWIASWTMLSEIEGTLPLILEKYGMIWLFIIIVFSICCFATWLEFYVMDKVKTPEQR